MGFLIGLLNFIGVIFYIVAGIAAFGALIGLMSNDSKDGAGVKVGLIAADAIAQAEENLRLNRDYYRVGATKMSDLLEAQEQYQQACDRYTDAFAEFQMKQLEYRQATGQE